LILVLDSARGGYKLRGISLGNSLGHTCRARLERDGQCLKWNLLNYRKAWRVFVMTRLITKSVLETHIIVEAVQHLAMK
jgi:hypothetical protein